MLTSLPITPALEDAVTNYQKILNTPDPFPGDRLIATANAAGYLADLVLGLMTQARKLEEDTKQLKVTINPGAVVLVKGHEQDGRRTILFPINKVGGVKLSSPVDGLAMWNVEELLYAPLDVQVDQIREGADPSRMAQRRIRIKKVKGDKALAANNNGCSWSGWLKVNTILERFPVVRDGDNMVAASVDEMRTT